MKKQPAKLDSLLESALSRPELVKAGRARIALTKWDAIVGEILKKKCWPSKFDHGTLHIWVAGSTWAQELQMQKGKLLKRLNEEAGEGLFQDIRFSIGTSPLEFEEKVPDIFLPDEIEIKFSEIKLEEIGRRALGRLKSASKRKDKD